MQDRELTAGDRFLLEWQVLNPGPALTAEQAIVLDVWGLYFFWPNWTDVTEWQQRTFAGAETHEETILDFIWPSGVGAAEGIWFWAALFDIETLEIYGGLQSISFLYE